MQIQLITKPTVSIGGTQFSSGIIIRPQFWSVGVPLLTVTAAILCTKLTKYGEAGYV